jgi:RNA polymerase sigma factor (sigma-70 family)
MPKAPSAQSPHPPPDFCAQIEHAQAGCAACLDHLMVQHDALVHWVIRHYGSGPLSYDEALQAGRIGLWQALRHFDPARGVTFSSYAVVAIGRHIDRERQRFRRFWRPRPFLPPNPLPDPLEEATRHLTCQAVPRWVAQLPPRLRFVACAYYGLDGYRSQGLPALARRLGCSKQRAHQMLHEALHWLALPQLSWEVRLLLERTAERELRAALRAWPLSRRLRWTRWRPCQ